VCVCVCVCVLLPLQTRLERGLFEIPIWRGSILTGGWQELCVGNATLLTAREYYIRTVYTYIPIYIHIYTPHSPLPQSARCIYRVLTTATMTHWQYYIRFRLVFFFFNESFLRKFLSLSLSLSRPPTFLRASQTQHSIYIPPRLPHRSSFIPRIIYRTVILFLVRFSTGIFDNRTRSCDKHTCVFVWYMRIFHISQHWRHYIVDVPCIESVVDRMPTYTTYVWILWLYITGAKAFVSRREGRHNIIYKPRTTSCRILRSVFSKTTAYFFIMCTLQKMIFLRAAHKVDLIFYRFNLWLICHVIETYASTATYQVQILALTVNTVP